MSHPIVFSEGNNQPEVHTEPNGCDTFILNGACVHVQSITWHTLPAVMQGICPTDAALAS